MDAFGIRAILLRPEGRRLPRILVQCRMHCRFLWAGQFSVVQITHDARAEDQRNVA